MNLNKDKLIVLAATGCLLGRIPVAPGTFGTLAALPLVFVLMIIPPSFQAVCVAAFILFSVYTAEKALEIIGGKDPGCIVIDEMAGYIVTMSVVPVNPFTLLAGFFLFRFFDIAKFPPIKYFESFSGGAGIVLDDIMAGIFSSLILKITYQIYLLYAGG